MHATRRRTNPIIRPDMDDVVGSNVQGPSLIRVPDWVDAPLGRYYLYFADHKGSSIRLAYADDLDGPWRIHSPGALHLRHSHFLVEPAAVPSEVNPTSSRWADAAEEDIPTPIDSATKPQIASPNVHVRPGQQQIVMYCHGLEGFRHQRTRRRPQAHPGLHHRSGPRLVELAGRRAPLGAGTRRGMGRCRSAPSGLKARLHLSTGQAAARSGGL